MSHVFICSMMMRLYCQAKKWKYKLRRWVKIILFSILIILGGWFFFSLIPRVTHMLSSSEWSNVMLDALDIRNFE